MRYSIRYLLYKVYAIQIICIFICELIIKPWNIASVNFLSIFDRYILINTCIHTIVRENSLHKRLIVVVISVCIVGENDTHKFILVFSFSYLICGILTRIITELVSLCTNQDVTHLYWMSFDSPLGILKYLLHCTYISTHAWNLAITPIE